MCAAKCIAFRSGALPEIIEHGKTGFLVEDVYDMAEAIRAVDTLDPELCRETARRRFSLDRMVAQYLCIYSRLAIPN